MRAALGEGRKRGKDERGRTPGLKEATPRIAGSSSARGRAAGLPGLPNEDRSRTAPAGYMCQIRFLQEPPAGTTTRAA